MTAIPNIDTLAYYFALKGSGLWFKIFKRHSLGKKEVERLLRLLISNVRGLYDIGILDDKDMLKIIDYSLRIIVNGKSNPVEAMTFLLATVAEAIAKYKEYDAKRIREYIRQAKILAESPVIKER